MSQKRYLYILAMWTLFIAHASGLWPYRYYKKTEKFVWIWYYELMKIVVILCIVSAVNVGQSASYSVDLFKNIVLQLLTSVYMFYCAFNFIFLLSTQCFKYKLLKTTLKKSIKLIKVLNHKFSISELSYISELIKFTIKTVGVLILIIYSILEHLSEVGMVMSMSKMILMFCTLIPFITLKIYPDCFYGSMLISRVYFKKINDEVEQILKESVILKQRRKLSNPLQHRIGFNELCEQLDQLSTLHQNLLEVTKAINEACSLQLMLFLVYMVFAILMDSFVGYILIIRLSKEIDFTNISYILWNIFIGLVATYTELLLTINVSNGVMEEV